MGYGGGGGSGGGGGGSYGGGGGGGVSSSANPPTAGAFRYNTDSSQLEIYDGNQWTGVLATSPEQQTGGTRMVIGGGLNPGAGNDHILYVNVSTTGNSLEFGNFAAGSITHGLQSGSSRTRGIFAGGYRNNIEYITISSTGNGIDFGDKIDYLYNTSQAHASNSTRMLTFGGYNYIAPAGWAEVNQIQKIEMSTLGNSVDWGDIISTGYFMAGCASPTRAVFGSASEGLQYITISTQGNSAEFGGIPEGVKYSAHSNAVRGVFSGTLTYPTCRYVNIATLGDAQAFGDLSVARNYASAASGSPTRGVVAGGVTPTYLATIDYYQIMSTGDLVDFGDLNEARPRAAGLSNGHGGL